MSRDNGVGIVVSEHAIERWRERDPRAGNHRDAQAAIFSLVHSAIRHGRMSKRKPAWAAFIHRSRDGAKQSDRYVWTADEQVAFVLTKNRLARAVDPEKALSYRQRWVVVTCLPRIDASDSDVERQTLNRLHFDNARRRLKSGHWEPGRKKSTGGYRRRGQGPFKP